MIGSMARTGLRLRQDTTVKSEITKVTSVINLKF